MLCLFLSGSGVHPLTPNRARVTDRARSVVSGHCFVFLDPRAQTGNEGEAFLVGRKGAILLEPSALRPSPLPVSARRLPLTDSDCSLSSAISEALEVREFAACSRLPLHDMPLSMDLAPMAPCLAVDLVAVGAAAGGAWRIGSVRSRQMFVRGHGLAFV